MNGLYTAVITVCASVLVCSLVSVFVKNEGTGKILNLVLGAFMVCSLILPIKNAVSALNINLKSFDSAENISASSDEAYNISVISATKDNLEKTLTDILAQNSISINSNEIILACTDENRIIISSISIYINKDSQSSADSVKRITEQNFGITPEIITE